MSPPEERRHNKCIPVSPKRKFGAVYVQRLNLWSVYIFRSPKHNLVTYKMYSANEMTELIIETSYRS